MTDEEILDEARKQQNDELLIQEPGPGGPEGGLDQIIDRVSGGAWVMAWVWVPEKGDS